MKKKTKLSKFLKAASAPIATYREQIFNTASTPTAFREVYPKMLSDKKDSMGRLTPWAFFIEPVKGCNLSCWHCGTRLFEKKKYEFMSMETLEQTLDIIKTVSPRVRIDFVLAGEPTMHPNLLQMVQRTREVIPRSHIVVYTNGVRLIKGELTYAKLFEAGVNFMFTDMYAPKEKHIALAEESGVEYFEQANPPKDCKNGFSHADDKDFKLICLAENPDNWTKARLGRVKLNTWLNNLDWDIAKKKGLEPVKTAPNRRCDQPTKYVNIMVDGSYTVCCADMIMRESSVHFPTVADGVEGFFKFWFGKYMQDVRHRVYNKDRKSHELCSRCQYTTGRCDVAWWPEQLLNDYWDGQKWSMLNDSK